MPETAEKRPSRPSLTPWWVFVLAAVVVVALLLGFLLLRGCTPSRATTGRTETFTERIVSLISGAPPAMDTLAIQNAVYSALEQHQLGNGDRSTTLVYIGEISTDNGVLVVLRATKTTAEIANIPGIGGPHVFATACENAVLSGVPQVTQVDVVDADRSVLGTAKRR